MDQSIELCYHVLTLILTPLHVQTESHAREIKSSPVEYNDNKEKRLALRYLPLQMIAHLKYYIDRVPSFPT